MCIYIYIHIYDHGAISFISVTYTPCQMYVKNIHIFTYIYVYLHSVYIYTCIYI